MGKTHLYCLPSPPPVGPANGYEVDPEEEVVQPKMLFTENNTNFSRLYGGNNDTPYPTACNPLYGHMQNFANYLLAHGYRPSELWGLGYQGDQCDLLADQTRRSAFGHTSAASVRGE